LKALVHEDNWTQILRHITSPGKISYISFPRAKLHPCRKELVPEVGKEALPVKGWRGDALSVSRYAEPKKTRSR